METKSIKVMKHICYYLLLATVLLSATACHKDIPITDIFLDPAAKTLFIGESFDLTIQYLPEDATHADDIQVYSTNESIITYANGKVTAKDGGSAAITASCGNVLGQCRVKVYKYSLYKGGKNYGIDFVKGYGSKMGEDTMQAVDIYMTHNDSDGSTQNFQFWMRTSQFGKDVDFTKDPGDALVSVFMNNNEDGYTVFMGEEGIPSIVLADWTSTDVTLTRGILHVEQVHSNHFKIKADFELSNGYRFGTDWDGDVSLEIE